MQYLSTRGDCIQDGASRCFISGIASDGGLFVPESFPKVSLEEIISLKNLTYSQRCAFILSRYLDDFTPSELEKCVSAAYDSGSFDCAQRAPLNKFEDSAYMLELWHGPTLAFKDMALQLLPHLLVTAKRKLDRTETTLILVATSGDTGKAALEGFCDVEGIKIAVFYPDQGVSLMQKLQMTTQTGGNVLTVAVRGNFDDAQTGVKRIFADSNVKEQLKAENVVLSSANSINWGRLVPQITYYFSAYADMCAQGAVKPGDKINFAVPTGNFGNILAGYYAMRMGLPVNRFICASNINNVLTDFINDGVYNARREFHKTTSPSMDILISSNLERLLFELFDRNALKVKECMDDLKNTGSYSISESLRKRLTEKEGFWGGYCSEAEVSAAIKAAYEKSRRIIDPHTAVAVGVYKKYLEKTGESIPTVIVSTASAFKFPSSVLEAITGEKSGEFDAIKKLETLGGIVPQSIKELASRPVLHKTVCDKAEMPRMVLEFAAK